METVVLNYAREYKVHQSAMEKLRMLRSLKNDADIAFCKLFGGEDEPNTFTGTSHQLPDAIAE